MLEHHRQAREKQALPGHRPQTLGDPSPGEQRKGREGMTRAQARHQAAREDHEEGGGGREPGLPAEPMRRQRSGEAQRQREPKRRREEQQTHSEVSGQAEVADPRLVGEAALHHQPSDQTLQGPEADQERQAPQEPAVDHPAPGKPAERDDEPQPDHPPEEPVEILWPVDRPKALEVHGGVHQPKLGRRLIQREGSVPIGLRQGRQGAEDRRPLGDREAGLGQPDRPAEDDHRQEQQGS